MDKRSNKDADPIPERYRLYFPDGDWFRDEDGNTEFTRTRALAFMNRLADHVILELRVWPQS